MKYFIISAGDARDKNYPAPYNQTWDEYLRWEDDEYENLLYEEDDEVLRYIANDGWTYDCPEDATLTRGFSWIIDELHRAYNRGYVEGLNDSN